MSETIYLAIGSNLGDRQANLAAAQELLRPYVTVELVSSLYETEAAYVTDQPNFLNGALRGRTELEPEALLDALKEIEAALGRTAGPRYGPRPADLDILIYGDRVINTPRLIVPHLLMAERPFVLVPLAEIAPDLVPPGWDRSVAAQSLAAHGIGNVIRKWTIDD
jgi:2-amino-4-hydroxy-6-hydroxymethyldihydropteridine diphosphokinase